MATKETVSKAAPRAEFAKKYSEDFLKQRFADSKEAFKRLWDYTKKPNRSIGVFDKELLRGYFQNIASNE